MKTIGLIGGMSWESTAHYYRIVNEEAGRLRGGLHSASVIVDSLDFAPIEALQRAGRWDEAGTILARSAIRLEKAGAEIIGLATNTMHIVAEEITRAVKAPFLHIADPTAEALKACGVTQAGLLGTRFTMEMPFYKDRLRAYGIAPLMPDADIPALNAIIYDELCRGIVRAESRQVYVMAISALAARGAEAVILGCTEIGMLIDESTSPLPVFDTAALHARALVKAALS